MRAATDAGMDAAMPISCSSLVTSWSVLALGGQPKRPRHPHAACCIVVSIRRQVVDQVRARTAAGRARSSIAALQRPGRWPGPRTQSTVGRRLCSPNGQQAAPAGSQPFAGGLPAGRAPLPRQPGAGSVSPAPRAVRGSLSGQPLALPPPPSPTGADRRLAPTAPSSSSAPEKLRPVAAVLQQQLYTRHAAAAAAATSGGSRARSPAASRSSLPPTYPPRPDPSCPPPPAAGEQLDARLAGRSMQALTRAATRAARSAGVRRFATDPVAALEKARRGGARGGARVAAAAAGVLTAGAGAARPPRRALAPTRRPCCTAAAALPPLLLLPAQCCPRCCAPPVDVERRRWSTPLRRPPSGASSPLPACPSARVRAHPPACPTPPSCLCSACAGPCAAARHAAPCPPCGLGPAAPQPAGLGVPATPACSKHSASCGAHLTPLPCLQAWSCSQCPTLTRTTATRPATPT